MDTREGITRLVETAEKLLFESERLKREVAVLNGRIQKHEDEIHFPVVEPPKPRKTWNIVDAINMIDRARDSIRNSEYELTAIRGRMDTIECDAISREEMKPWLK